MKKHLLIIFSLVFVIVTSADEQQKIKSKSLKQIKTFLDVLGTDESRHRTYFIAKEGSSGKTMNDSINVCQKFGLQLVSMDSKVEQDWLLKTLTKTHVGYFIGLTRGANDTWNRINNLGVIDFDLNFHYGEPNNQAGAEDCLEIVGYYDRHLKLNDIPCAESKSFICVLDG